MFRAKNRMRFSSMIGSQSFGNLSVSKKVAISSISHSLCASPGRTRIWSHGEEEESWWRGSIPKNQSHTLKSALIFLWKNGGGRQPSYMRDSCTSIYGIKIHDIYIYIHISMHDNMPFIIKTDTSESICISYHVIRAVPQETGCHRSPSLKRLGRCWDSDTFRGDRREEEFLVFRFCFGGGRFFVLNFFKGTSN